MMSVPDHRWLALSPRVLPILALPLLAGLPGAAPGDAGGLPSFLVPDDPVLRWEKSLTNPRIPGVVKVLEGAWMVPGLELLQEERL